MLSLFGYLQIGSWIWGRINEFAKTKAGSAPIEGTITDTSHAPRVGVGRLGAYSWRVGEMSEDLDYAVRIPLAKMDFAEQERFWVIEGRLKREVNFDSGFGFTKDGPCRDWELDWSLSGELSAQDIMDRLKAENIPFTVRVSVADTNMRD